MSFRVSSIRYFIMILVLSFALFNSESSKAYGQELAEKGIVIGKFCQLLINIDISRMKITNDNFKISQQGEAKMLCSQRSVIIGQLKYTGQSADNKNTYNIIKKHTVVTDDKGFFILRDVPMNYYYTILEVFGGSYRGVSLQAEPNIFVISKCKNSVKVNNLGFLKQILTQNGNRLEVDATIDTKSINVDINDNEILQKYSNEVDVKEYVEKYEIAKKKGDEYFKSGNERLIVGQPGVIFCTGSSVVTEGGNPYPYEEWKDTFPNGIFKWGTSSFPTERFKYRLSVEKREEGELEDAFKDPTFSDIFGKRLKEEYLEGRLIDILYAVKERGNYNTSEIAVAFKVGGEYYAGFLPATNEKIRLLEKFNKR